MADEALSLRAVQLMLAGTAIAVIAGAAPMLAGGAPFGDDNSSHLAEIAFVGERLRAGDVEMWFDGANLGYPLFLAYQPLPSLVIGALVAIGGDDSALFLFKLSIALLFALMPVFWYRGARAFGLSRLESVVFGLLSLGMRDHRDFGFSMNSIFNTGLYTQLWAMALLPIAAGTSWAYVVEKESSARMATLAASATVLAHAFFAIYWAMLLVLMLFSGARPLRLARIALPAIALTAFWWLPFVYYFEYQGGLPFIGAHENGYSPAKLLGHFLTGAFFDHRKIPWITGLVLIGLVLAIKRRADPRARWTLITFALTLLLLLESPLFAGRLEVIRFFGGLHFTGALLAAPAAALILEKLVALLKTKPIVLAGLTLIYGADRFAEIRLNWKTLPLTNAGLDRAADELRAGPDGRVLAHKELLTFNHFYLNLLPYLADRPGVISHGRGYHDTHSLYFVEGIPLTPEALRLFAVRSLVSKRSELQVEIISEPYGYFDFIRTPIALGGDIKKLRPLVAESSLLLFAKRALPIVDGRAREPKPIDDRPISSRILSEARQPNQYTARVDAAGGEERLLLKVSHHPGWIAEVDGQPAKIDRVGPNLMVIDVPAGEHQIVFRFRRPRLQLILFALSLLIAVWKGRTSNV